MSIDKNATLSSRQFVTVSSISEGAIFKTLVLNLLWCVKKEILAACSINQFNLFKNVCHWFLRSCKSSSHHVRVSKSFEYISCIHAIHSITLRLVSCSCIRVATAGGFLLGSNISFATLILPAHRPPVLPLLFLGAGKGHRVLGADSRL